MQGNIQHQPQIATLFLGDDWPPIHASAQQETIAAYGLAEQHMTDRKQRAGPLSRLAGVLPWTKDQKKAQVSSMLSSWQYTSTNHARLSRHLSYHVSCNDAQRTVRARVPAASRRSATAPRHPA